MELQTSIINIKGIGPKTENMLKKIGVYTVGDILLHFPRNYLLYPKAQLLDNEIEPNKIYAIRAIVSKTPIVKNNTRIPITLLYLYHAGVNMECIWYRMPYIKSKLIPGKYIIFYGKIKQKNNRFVMEQPDVYTEEEYARIENNLTPIYSLTAGLSNKMVTKTIAEVIKNDNLFMDYLPQDIKAKYNLCDYNYALKQIHFPDNMDSLIVARKRLVFDEFFIFILAMQLQKSRQIKAKNHFVFKKDDFVEKLIKKLPYELTDAQKRALSEVRNDLRKDVSMERLIQGDVGSGKTIVAFLAMCEAFKNGYQSAIMAPTEVLARQHYDTFLEWSTLFGLDIPLILLTGSMTAKQKREAYDSILNTPNAMIIGTHAVIQEKVEYCNLALVVTDEQHRFGVQQRSTFSKKGDQPHIIVMSATPIPRTLAIILYGDLDVSIIDEVPARRLPTKNCVVDSGYRNKAYEFIASQVKMGHQAYVICPLVEESENMDGENVTDYTKMMQQLYKGKIKVAMLNGKMKPAQKNAIMESFAKNEVQVLVSTTVVEVGVNVPNSTVMMIENADRFGLAQLHQLRGRIGRGDAQGYCIMINTSKSKNAKKRLEILNKSNDGFYIASEDLKLRGPGDFFGIRQSGEFNFQLADIYQDADVLKKAADSVNEILDQDSTLQEDKNKNLKIWLERHLSESLQNINL
ncbi:ATP-dependent DNA helicase RecG [Lachnobacterium bovis]|uniref:ATP-dependent DNA helicase RecG n=1 Tax=Lachnobacterium bovis TaxID=140626 RepID=UPI00047F852A|nr:ATP-dependent DNA helicase RecG [Lachnobacterium bovis]